MDLICNMDECHLHLFSLATIQSIFLKSCYIELLYFINSFNTNSFFNDQKYHASLHCIYHYLLIHDYCVELPPSWCFRRFIYGLYTYEADIPKTFGIWPLILNVIFSYKCKKVSKMSDCVRFCKRVKCSASKWYCWLIVYSYYCL